MKKIVSLVFVLLVIFNVPACKKSSDTQPPTTLQKIQAKWLLETWVLNSHYSGDDHIETITGGPNDFVDFRTDAKVYTKIGSSRDTSIYALSGDTKIILDGTDTLDIKTLTANSLVLYDKETYSPSEFTEVTLTLKK